MKPWMVVTGVGLTIVNFGLLIYFMFREWQLCTWPFGCEWYAGPYAVSDQTLSMQLAILQTTLVSIGVTLTCLGVIGWRTIQDRAEAEARKVAKRAAAAALNKEMKSWYDQLMEAREAVSGPDLELDTSDSQHGG